MLLVVRCWLLVLVIGVGLRCWFVCVEILVYRCYIGCLVWCVFCVVDLDLCFLFVWCFCVIFWWLCGLIDYRIFGNCVVVVGWVGIVLDLVVLLCVVFWFVLFVCLMFYWYVKWLVWFCVLCLLLFVVLYFWNGVVGILLWWWWLLWLLVGIGLVWCGYKVCVVLVFLISWNLLVFYIGIFVVCLVWVRLVLW